jgi:hypothetical protein
MLKVENLGLGKSQHHVVSIEKIIMTVVRAISTRTVLAHGEFPPGLIQHFAQTVEYFNHISIVEL